MHTPYCAQHIFRADPTLRSTHIHTIWRTTNITPHARARAVAVESLDNCVQGNDNKGSHKTLKIQELKTTYMGVKKAPYTFEEKCYGASEKDTQKCEITLKRAIFCSDLLSASKTAQQILPSRLANFWVSTH